MQNINIRFNGQSNLGRVQKEVQGLTASFEALNYTIHQQARQQGAAGGQYLRDQMSMMNTLRRQTNDYITAQGGMLTETVRIKAATTDFNERLAKQKVHIRDIAKNWDVVKGAMREQVALQNMFLSTYNKTASGKITGDIYVPREAIRSMRTFRTELGYMGQLLGSSSLQLQNWGKNTQWAGRQLMVGFTVPTMIAAGAIGKLGYDADKALTRIVKVYDAGADGVMASNESIRESSMATAKQLASQYGQSVKETLDIQAELAAQGKVGNDLRQQTVQISRAMLLGDLDREKALSTNLALTDAFKMKTEELSTAWNFFNSVENTTSLTMADITESLPRVSGIMQSLGADFKQTTVLMTAFKAAGIDVAEGATALKSITFKILSPSKKAKDTFENLTGLNYSDILKKTKGEIIPTLLELGKTMKGLSKLQRVDLVSDLIGIHQGSKFFGLVEQMANLNDETTQVGRAFAVANQDAQQWADTASGEIAKLQASVSNRFKRAVESAKASMADLGMTVLQFIMPVVEFGAKIIQAANNLSDGQKKFLLWFAAITSGIGLFTMFIGLTMNLVGMLGRTAAGILKMIAPLRIMNAEQKAAELQAKMTSAGLRSEAMILEDMARSMAKVTEAHIAMQRQVSMPGFFMQNGTLMRESKILNAQGQPGAPVRATGAQFRQWNELGAVTTDVEEASARTAKNWGTTVGHMARASVLAGMIGGAIAPVGGKTGQILDIAMWTGIVATMLPMERIANKINARVASLTSETGRLSRGFGAVRGAMGSLASFATGPWGIAIGAAIAGVVWAINDHNKKLEEARKKYEAVKNSAEAWAGVLGFEYTNQTQSALRPGAQGETDLAAKMEEFRKSNADTYAALQKFQGDAVTQRERLGAAIDEAFKVRLHGGSVKAAHEAALIAMRIMKDDISKEKLEVLINARVNLEDPSGMIRERGAQLAETMNKAIKDKFENQDSWFESFTRLGSGNGINSVAENEIGKFVDSWYETLQTADDATRAQAMRNMDAKFTADLRKTYENVRKAVPNAPEVKTFEAFVEAATKNQAGESIQGLNAELAKQVDGLRGSATAYKAFINAVGQSADVNKEAYEAAYNLNSIYDEMGIKREDVGKNIDNELQKERLLRGEHIRMAAAGRDVASSTNSVASAASIAAQAWKEFDAAMKSSGVTSGEAIDGLKNAMVQSMDTVYTAADSMLQDRQEAELNGIKSRTDAQIQAVEDRLEKARTRNEKQERSLEERQKAAQDRLERQQKARRKAIEDYYDARIKKVDQAIEAEKKAEDTRQKIFEAEKARIERMAELYNKNIDFNTALTTGQFDEAAKIANDMSASEQTFGVTNASDASKNASDKRVESLDAQKTRYQKARDARLDALKDVEDAEKNALRRTQQRQKDALKAEIDRITKAAEADKKAIQDRGAAAERAARRRHEIEKLNIELTMSVLKQFIPRDEKERKAHIARIEKAYNLHGGVLTAQGTRWGQIVGRALDVNVRAAADGLRTKVRWDKIGEQAAAEMIYGSLGINLKQYQKFLKTGEFPTGAAAAAGPAAASSGMRYVGNGKVEAYDSKHSGGIIGKTPASRTGYSGGQSQSEVLVNALKGEGVLNKRAVNTLGEDFINNANSGRLNSIPKNIGGPDLAMPMGLTGILGGIMAGIGKNMITNFLMGNHERSLPSLASMMGMDAGLGLEGFDAFFKAIASQESGGNYGAVNASTGALGKYQILPSNVGPWSDKYLGRRISPNEFLHTPALQEQLARAVLSDYFNKYGARGAASAWYSGNPDLHMSTKSQNGYPSIKDYVDSIMAKMAQYGAPLGKSIVGRGGWMMPAAGPVTSRFGYRIHPITGQRTLHAGSDIGAPMGAPIRAPRAGKVASAGWVNGYGNYTVIDHGNGIKTAYGHQSALGVQGGQSVSQGQVIGKVGSTGNSTGPHLHFEYIKNGVRVNPNQIIPGLLTGASVLRGGLANLHAGETVIPKPLTKELHKGIESMSDGSRISVEKIELVFMGPASAHDANNIKNAVKDALRELEREKGPKRKVGNN